MPRQSPLHEKTSSPSARPRSAHQTPQEVSFHSSEWQELPRLATFGGFEERGPSHTTPGEREALLKPERILEWGERPRNAGSVSTQELTRKFAWHRHRQSIEPGMCPVHPSGSSQGAWWDVPFQNAAPSDLGGSVELQAGTGQLVLPGTCSEANPTMMVLCARAVPLASRDVGLVITLVLQVRKLRCFDGKQVAEFVSVM